MQQYLSLIFEIQTFIGCIECNVQLSLYTWLVTWGNQNACHVGLSFSCCREASGDINWALLKRKLPADGLRWLSQLQLERWSARSPLLWYHHVHIKAHGMDSHWDSIRCWECAIQHKMCKHFPWKMRQIKKLLEFLPDLLFRRNLLSSSKLNLWL